MSISSLQCKDWRARATEPGRGLLLVQKPVFTPSAKPLGRDDTKLVPRKTSRLYFKTFCQERPLEQM